MKKSQIFYSDRYKTIESDLINLINSQPDFLSARTTSSPRATGDAIQEIISDNFQSLINDLCTEHSDKFARRAMADLAFVDKDDFHYTIDVKTH